jgi:hypothetical protein
VWGGEVHSQPGSTPPLMILDWLLFLSVPFRARCWMWVPHVEDLAVTSGCVFIVAFVRVYLYEVHPICISLRTLTGRYHIWMVDFCSDWKGMYLNSSYPVRNITIVSCFAGDLDLSFLCIHGIFPYPFYSYCFVCPACDGLVTISWGLFWLLPFFGKFCVQIVGGFVLGVHFVFLWERWLADIIYEWLTFVLTERACI